MSLLSGDFKERRNITLVIQNLSCILSLEAAQAGDTVSDRVVNGVVEQLKKLEPDEILDLFFPLSSTRKEKWLKNPDFAAFMKKTVRNANQKRIVSEKWGNYLFHELIKNKSERTRSLAIECIKAGFDVNKTNLEGDTGLELAVDRNDPRLVEEFLRKGAPLTNHLVENLDEITDSLSDRTGFDESLWIGCQTILLNQNISFNKIPKSQIRASAKAIKWLLLNTSISSSSDEDKKTLADWVVRNILQRSVISQQNVYLLEKLLEEGTLHWMTMGNGQSAVEFITSKSTLPSSLKEKARAITADKTILPILQKLYRLTPKMEKGTVYEKMKSITELDENLRLLGEKNYPGNEGLVKKARRLSLEIHKSEKRFQKLEKRLENGTLAANKIPRDFWAYLAAKNRWDVAKNLLALLSKHPEQLIISQMVFHIFMDKFKLPEQKAYESSFFPFTAQALLVSLARLKDEVKNSTIPDLKVAEFVEKLERQMAPWLKDAIPFAQSMAGIEPQDFSGYITKRIQTMAVGESFLVPTGRYKHQSLMLVTKKSPKSVRLTHYNTGDGIEHHHRWKDSKRYQTYDVIDDVPIESVLKTSPWEALFRLRVEAKSMDPVYTLMRDELGKGGNILPASEHEEEYERIQESGTCAMQSLMALLRHQVMQMAKGTPAENEALYKLIKTRMFTAYLKETLPKVDDTIRKYMAPILKKLKAEDQLIKIAADPDRIDQALKLFDQLFEKLGEKTIAEELRHFEGLTTMARYATLRRYSNLLCAAWIQNPDSPVPEDTAQMEALQLAFAKIEYRKAIMKNVVVRLENYVKEKDGKGIRKELYWLLLLSPFPEKGMEEAVKHLGQQELLQNGLLPETIELFIRDLNRKNRKEATPLVRDFADRVHAQGNEKLAAAVKETWRKLGEA